MIFDYYLLEGVNAFFRAALVIFKLTEKQGLKARDMMDFLALFEQTISGLENYKNFKDEMNQLFLNSPLLTECRKKSITKKQESYYSSPKFKNPEAEKCPVNSVFCSWVRGQRFVNDSNLIFRCENIVEGLRFNHFNPFKLDALPHPPDAIFSKFKHGFVLADPNGTLPEKLEHVQSMMDIQTSFSSPNICVNIAQPNKNNGYGFQQALDVPSNCGNKNSSCRTQKKSGGKNIVNMSNHHKISINAIPPESTNANNVKFNHPRKDSTSSPDKPPSEFLTIEKAINAVEREILMIRSEHICQYRDAELARRKENHTKQTLFFDTANKHTIKYLGENIETLITRYQLKAGKRGKVLSSLDSVPGATALKFHNKIARLSFMVPAKKNRFFSVEVKKLAYFSDKKPIKKLNKLTTSLPRGPKKLKKSQSFDFAIGGNLNEVNLKMAQRSYGQAIQFYNNASFTRDSLKIEHRASGKLIVAFRKAGSRSLDITKTRAQKNFNMPPNEFRWRGHSLA